MTDVLDIAKKNGRWTECPSCKEIIITKKLEENLWVCPHCNYHFRLNATRRIAITCDEDSFTELPIFAADLDKDIRGGSYRTDDAIKGGMACIEGLSCVAGIMDFAFKGGSMGVSVAQAVINLMKHAKRVNHPFIMFCASGGVRVQEGIWGLMQMLRTAQARNLTADVPMITVFTDPTLGGVTASFAALADIMLAEPGSNIGFAGPRVVENTINHKLPPGFQSAEMLLSQGFLDNIVDRHQLRDTLAYLLRWF